MAIETKINRTMTERRQMEHQRLMDVTAKLPCKKIPRNGKDYLERYFVGETITGRQKQLHHFLNADGERYFHSHPWTAISEILCGGYQEEILTLNCSPELVGKEFTWDQATTTTLQSYFENQVNIIEPNTIHRISHVIPNTWTVLTLAPERLDHWFFIDENGQKSQIETAPKDWWINCKTRDGEDYDASLLALPKKH
jgi:hypothetical protein